MKKIMIILASLIFVASFAFGQNVLEQYWAGDAVYNFHFFTGPDGNPAPDGWLIQIMLVGSNGLIDGLDPVTRDPLGDDNWCLNNNYYQDHLNGALMVGVPGTWYAYMAFKVEDFAGSPPEPVCNLGETIYFILYNDADRMAATHYCVSQTYTTHSSGGPYNQPIEIWYDAPGEWIPFGAPSHEYVYWTVQYADSSACDFGTDWATPGELVDAWVINTDAKADTVNWGDAEMGARHDTIRIDITALGWSTPFNYEMVVIADPPDTSGPNPPQTNGQTGQASSPGDQGGVTLPVELSAFTAVTANKLVVLKWTTQTETNNRGFNVYRGTTNDLNSADKINLAMIQGQGTSSEPNKYSFEDDTVENGNTYYYWLEQVDFDGESHFSWSIEATPEAPPPPPPPPPLSFGPAHPNPNNGACSIPFALPAQSKISIIIIDKNGNLIDVICDGTLSAGYHNIVWNAPENNKLYRCIFHQSDSNHWHGDILVE